MTKENGFDNKSTITISVYPAEGGFGCTVIEPTYAPLTQSFSIALTIAHGMVKMALERPDIIFEEGVNALANPIESDAVVSINDMVKKGKIH